MLTHIQRALRASIEGRAERLGPFVVRFDEDNDNPFLNYAIPDDGAVPTSQEVDSLIAAFDDGVGAHAWNISPHPWTSTALSPLQGSLPTWRWR